MTDISSILHSLGLPDSEVRVYLTALEKGSQPASALSKVTKLSRQSTYCALESLIDRGLVSSVIRDNKRYFAAEHPSKLVGLAARQQEKLAEQVADLKRALPELELRVGGERPVVKMFEGKEGLKATMDELLRADAYGVGIYDEMTDLDTMYAVLDTADLEPYREQVRSRKINTRSIHSGASRGSRSPYIKRTELPKGYSNFKTNIAIFDRFLHLVTFEGKIHSILIESPALARSIRILYDIAFKAVAQSRLQKR